MSNQSLGIDLKRLRAEQLNLVHKINLNDRIKIKDIKYVGGVDTSFFKKGNVEYAICVIVVLEFKTLNIVEQEVSLVRINFPYIPTFLTYRELPCFKAAFKKLKLKPDVFIFDANGILHPYKIGFATHAGILFNIVSVGVAKSLLCGNIIGDYVYFKGERLAYVLRRGSFKPLFISPGNNISLKTSINLVKRLFKYKNRKLPEPTRLADYISKEKKKIFK